MRLSLPALGRVLLGVWVYLSGSYFSYAQTSCAPTLTAGLQAWYPLEETAGASIARDATGHSYEGQLQGGSWQPTGGHDGGGALALVQGQYLYFPLPWHPAAYSLSFWLKPTRYLDGGQLIQGPGGWGTFAFHSNTSGVIYVGTDVATRIEYLVPNTVQLNVWQHFVFTFDNGVGTLYKNGQLLRQQGGMTVAPTWQGFALGASGDELYDEVRIYDRAVSPGEVQALYSCQPDVAAPLRLQLSPDITINSGQQTTLSATATPSPSALLFDGIDDLVRITDATTTSTTTVPILRDVANTFTVEAWVKPTATHQIDQQNNVGVDGTYGQRYLIFPTGGWNWGAGERPAWVSL